MIEHCYMRMKKKLVLFMFSLASILSMSAAPHFSGEQTDGLLDTTSTTPSVVQEQSNPDMADLMNQLVLLKTKFDASEDSAMLAIILSVVALLLGVASMVIALRNKSKSDSDKKVDMNSETDKKISLLSNQLKLQEEATSTLIKEIEGLRNLVRERRKDTSIAAFDNSHQSSAVSQQNASIDNRQEHNNTEFGSAKQHFQRVIKYAETLEGNGINVSDLVDDNSEYALLKVIIDSPSTAQFEVNDLQSAQAMLVSSYKYTIADFCNRLSASDAPLRIVTRKHGELKLQANKWVLTAKADVVME